MTIEPHLVEDWDGFNFKVEAASLSHWGLFLIEYEAWQPSNIFPARHWRAISASPLPYEALKHV